MSFLSNLPVASDKDLGNSHNEISSPSCVSLHPTVIPTLRFLSVALYESSKCMDTLDDKE